MAENNIYVHQNHNAQEIRNFSIEKLAAHPTGGDLYEGREWMLTTDNRKYRYAGGSITQVVEAADLNKFGIFVGAHDASLGAIPTTGSGVDSEGNPLAGTASIQAGDYWRISVAGTIVGIEGDDALSVGDILIALSDNATAASSFMGVQKNLDDEAIINGSGTVDYLVRWTPDGGSLGNSAIRDNGSQIGLGTAPSTAFAFQIDKSNETDNGLSVINYNNTINTTIAIEGNGGGGTAAAGYSVGLLGLTNEVGTGTIAIGIAAFGLTTTPAGYTKVGLASNITDANANNAGDTAAATFISNPQHANNNYGIIINSQNLGAGTSFIGKFADNRTEGVNKFLKSIDINGTAEWATIDEDLLNTSYETITATTVTPSKSVTYCDTSLNVVTVNLPPVASAAGKKFIIKRITAGANNVVIDGDSLETIDGQNTLTLYSQYDAVVLHSDGSEWFIIS